MAVEVTTRTASPDDRPRVIHRRLSLADLAFRNGLRLAGLVVLAITGLIAAFLIIRASSTLRAVGWRFLTNFQWLLNSNRIGVGAILPDTLIIAVIALIIAVPVALLTALFIAEYAPFRLRRRLIALIDLMAAIPSILYGLWGFFWLMPRFIGTQRWISDQLGFIPFLKVPGPFQPGSFEDSTFLAGTVVSLMIIPIIASISREVFSQAPQGEREAAYALGATRWGMITAVVLPYARGGIIGAIMLGFGRAMGETIVVAIIISQVFTIVTHPLQSGGNSIAALIAQDAEESTPAIISALIAAGLVLFVVTLIVNAIAAVIVARSRSGLQTAD
ncbi:MAG TPA: phosphate ABC transporter permease subunit PstC [Trebonia sp.]|nr:phosphate ABC transporter permease subunit PstC [Trebonia sp.]